MNNKVVVHTNQEVASGNVFEDIQNGCRSNILIGQMQSGKTETLNGVAMRFLTFFENSAVVYVSNPNDSDLKEQTKGRFNKFLISSFSYIKEEMVRPENREKRTKFIFNPDLKEGSQKYADIVDFCKNKTVLVIFDECHLALHQKGRNHEFLQAIGAVPIDKSSSQWKNKNVYILWCSATAFPQINFKQSRESQNLSEIGWAQTVLEPGEDYRGIKDIALSGRFMECMPYWDSTNPNKLSLDFVTSLKNTHGKGNVVLIRCNNRRNNQLKIELENLGYTVQLYHSDRTKSVHSTTSLREAIENEHVEGFELREKPLIFIILGTLRQGATIPTFNIAACYEGLSPRNGIAQLQGLIGRVCGYNKLKDKFPIYCSKEHINSYIDCLESNFTKPFEGGGTYCRPISKKSYERKYITVVDNFGELKKRFHRSGFTLSFNNVKDSSKGNSISGGNAYGRNIAAAILNKTRRAGANEGESYEIVSKEGFKGSYALYYVDGPSKTYPESFDELKSFEDTDYFTRKKLKFEDIINKTVVVVHLATDKPNLVNPAHSMFNPKNYFQNIINKKKGKK
jgi:hypothetical protein